LRVDDVGVLRPVEPGAPLDPKVGTRVAPGHVQLGLTAAEIDAIAHRLSRLLARVDRGKLTLF
jgi:hypothetical protein